MKVIVTGSTGLVGRALVRSLLADGHEVTRLVRGGSQGFKAPGTSAVHWDPEPCGRARRTALRTCPAHCGRARRTADVPGCTGTRSAAR